MVDYRALLQRSFIIYGGLVLLLIGVALFGVMRNHSRRWIPIGGSLLFQPSEFARIGVALALAMYYGDSRRAQRSLGELATGAGLILVPFYLIWRQPDLGTSLTLVPVFLGIVFLAGVRLKWLWIALAVVVVLSPVIVKYGVTPYQRARIDAFLDPGGDPKGKGYQQQQARIAVGSGGLVGKGFGAGTQGAYRFLPAAHTDFVFSGLAEEHGFLGVIVALGLYLFVILRSFDAAKLAKDRAGAFLVIGIISGFAFQVLYNIPMSAGMAPVRGYPLPLMSYGGSSLVATLAGFGLILNVRMRRFTN
jgi:rod shape determining protein RodA